MTVDSRGQFGSVVRTALVCLHLAATSLRAQQIMKIDSAFINRSTPAQHAVPGEGRDAIPLRMLPLVIPLQQAAGIHLDSVVAGAITELHSAVLLDSANGQLLVYDHDGGLVQRIGGRDEPMPVLNGATHLTIGRRNAIVVSTRNQSLLFFTLQDGRYRLSRQVDIRFDVHSMCYLNGWIVVNAPDASDFSVIKVLDYNTGALVRSFGTVYNSPDVASNVQAARGSLSCNHGNDLVVFAGYALPEVRGYLIGGAPKWRVRVPSPHVGARPVASHTALVPYGVLIQLAPAFDSLSTTGVTRAQSVFLGAAQGDVMGTGRWMTVVAAHNNRVLWRSYGNPEAMYLGWLVPISR